MRDVPPNDVGGPAVVRFLEGSCKNLEVVLADGFTIGRSRDCTVRLDSAFDHLVSGHHVRFLCTQAHRPPHWQWWLEDLDSRNGTWRIGCGSAATRVRCRVRLRNDDQYILGHPGCRGSVRLVLVAVESDAPDPSLDPSLSENCFRRGTGPPLAPPS